MTVTTESLNDAPSGDQSLVVCVERVVEPVTLPGTKRPSKILRFAQGQVVTKAEVAEVEERSGLKIKTKSVPKGHPHGIRGAIIDLDAAKEEVALAEAEEAAIEEGVPDAEAQAAAAEEEAKAAAEAEAKADEPKTTGRSRSRSTKKDDDA